MVLLAVSAALLAGCAAPARRAPVEGRDPAARRPASAPRAPLPPGARLYTVKPGDTLGRIALEAGQGWRDLARWNGLANPDHIQAGQVLRLTPPADPAPAPASAPTAAPRPAPAASIDWGWPVPGPLTAGYDGRLNQGLDFSGKAGDPIHAAAAGRVIYVGSAVRGLGNLIVIKHDENYLTAYAHTRVMLVKEDQLVRKGQKIAEMGDSDSDAVKLHFELRRDGRPLNPVELLPRR
ncbi:MAG: peptidoglycan DD-metalloendopeptidase family protein [Comamonadaceae bacterium]|nr:peptidoglycan DD-metalloendopeptidase family protein [Comamonadaceae bacterium]